MDSLLLSENLNQVANIGVIYEGATDYQVLENILVGYLGEDNFDLVPLQPILDETDKQINQGGWELVLAYCSSPRFAESLEIKDFIVIQIDTDQLFTHHNFSGINTNLPYSDLYQEVLQRFEQVIGSEIYSKYRSKIIFAISMSTIECWLLVLHCKDKQDGIKNCLERLHKCLQKGNSKINPYTKKPKEYEYLSREFIKRKNLIATYKLNPSLRSFIEELNSKFQKIKGN